MTIKVLITGTRMARNGLAWWLGRAGTDVTVAERAPEFRDGGQNVDMRGVGRTVNRHALAALAALSVSFLRIRPRLQRLFARAEQ